MVLRSKNRVAGAIRRPIILASLTRIKTTIAMLTIVALTLPGTRLALLLVSIPKLIFPEQMMLMMAIHADIVVR